MKGHMSDLRQALTKLAREVPETRIHIVPLLRRTAKKFEDAIKGKKFKNPETGNQVEFDSLPSEMQKRIRQKWVEKNPRGSGGHDDPKAALERDSDAYFAEHVSGSITKSELTKVLKDTNWSPRGKGSYDKKNKQLSLVLEHKKGKHSPINVTLGGSYMTNGDGKASVYIYNHKGGTHEDQFDLTGDPAKDAKKMMASLPDLLADLDR